MVIRSGLGLYNLSGGRSYDVLKIKKRIDEDMVLISYTASKTGKEKDAIIFIVDPCIKDYKEKLDRKELKKIFKSYNITKILAKRSINPKNPESKVYELIITNY